MKHWLSIFPFTLVVMLSGCGGEQQYVDFGKPKVKVVALSDTTFSVDNIYFPAVAKAAERSQFSFRVEGEVSDILVKEGDRIQKGDVIAELDPTDYQLDVDNASARYSVVNSQYRRSKPLVDKGLLAKSQFDEIAANRQIAYAALQLAKLRLSFTKLTSPMDGIVSRVAVEQFENIHVGQPIVNIHSIDSVEVVMQLPDRLYIRQPTQGVFDNIKALVKVPSGNEYSASIKEFTTEPDPTTGTFTVTLSLPMPDKEYILDGMAVEVTSKQAGIGLDANAQVLVPIEAVFNGDGDDLQRSNKFVWLVKSGTVSKQKVVLGKVSKDAAQVLAGLRPEDTVVISGLAKLRDGMTVEVVEHASKETGNE